MTKYETVCIRRYGIGFIVTEGADFAAKVTYHRISDAVYDPRTCVTQEMLIQRLGKWE